MWRRPIQAAVHVGLDQPRVREALAVVEANPSWSSINREVVQKLVPPAKFGH